MKKKFGKRRNNMLIDGDLFENKKAVRNLSNKKFLKNIILANDVYIDINAGIETYKKSNFLYGDMDDIRECFIEPNILQMNMSYIVKDYDGILYATYKDVFENAGYEVKLVNFIDFLESDKFNVFEYFNYEQDVSMFVNLITDSYMNKLSHSEKLIKNAERNLLEAILYYIMIELPYKEHNMKTVFKMLELARPYNTDNTEYSSDLDLLFNDIDSDESYHIALDKYKKFHTGAVHIEKTVVENVKKYLSLYDVNSIRSICNEDEIHIEEMVQEDEILFVVVPKESKEYEKIADIFMYQTMMYLDYIAEKEYKAKLPNPVHIMAPGMITPIVDIVLKNCFKRNYIVTFGVDSLAKYEDYYDDMYELIEQCSAFICYDYSNVQIRDFVKKLVINKYNSDIKTQEKLNPTINIELEDYMPVDDADCIVFLQYTKAICANIFEADRMSQYEDVSSKEMKEYMDSVEQAVASQIYSNLICAINKNLDGIKIGENVNIDIGSKKLIQDKVYENITMKVKKNML